MITTFYGMLPHYGPCTESVTLLVLKVEFCWVTVVLVHLHVVCNRCWATTVDLRGRPHGLQSPKCFPGGLLQKMLSDPSLTLTLLRRFFFSPFIFLPFCRLTDHLHVGLFLCSPLCSTDVCDCFCVSHIWTFHLILTKFSEISSPIIQRRKPIMEWLSAIY